MKLTDRQISLLVSVNEGSTPTRREAFTAIAVAVLAGALWVCAGVWANGGLPV